MAEAMVSAGAESEAGRDWVATGVGGDRGAGERGALDCRRAGGRWGGEGTGGRSPSALWSGSGRW